MTLLRVSMIAVSALLGACLVHGCGGKATGEQQVIGSGGSSGMGDGSVQSGGAAGIGGASGGAGVAATGGGGHAGAGAAGADAGGSGEGGSGGAAADSGTESGVDADAGADAGADADAPVDGGVDSGECTLFVDHGYCFEHTPVCSNDADCVSAGYETCELALGRCRGWSMCSCVSDGDCPPNSDCITNERVCGECHPRKPACAGPSDCGSAEQCVAAQCSAVCCA